MNIRKTAILLLLPVFLLSGCARELPEEEEGLGLEIDASSAASSEPEVPLPVSFALPYNQDAALDPITCPDGIQQTLGTLLYEGLFELDQQLEPQNKLCSSASYDAEAMTWTLQLRSGVTFSDGSPLTAGDVAATLNRARTSQRYQTRLSSISSVRASNDMVVITLNKANTDLPALLDIPIVKSGTESDAVPLGTGPYILVTEDGGAFLTANTSWWNGNVQPISRIELVDCTTTDVVRYQFTSHAVQLITADLTGVSSMSAAGNFAFQDADTTVLQYVGFHTNHALLSDPAVRRAIGLGIDREAVVNAYLSGHAEAAQFPVSPVCVLYPQELESTYSYAAFESAMTEAGLNSGTTHSLTLLVNSENSFKVSIAKYLASALSAFDLEISVNALPWEEYQAALAAGNFDLYYGETRLTADWDLTQLVGTGGSLNFGNYTDPVLDDLLANYGAAEDRAASMRSVCAYLSNQAPILPVCFKRTSVLTQADVLENLSPTASNPFYGLENLIIHLKDGG